MSTHPGLTRSTQIEGQFRLSDGLHDFRLRRLAGAGCRNTEVLCLIDVGAAGPRVKRRDQSKELALQHEFIVPRPPALRAARFILVVVFLLQYCNTKDHEVDRQSILAILFIGRAAPMLSLLHDWPARC